MRRRLLAALTVAAVLAAAAAALLVHLRSSPNPRLFASSSPFNRPIEAGAAVDPDSDRYVAALLTAIRDKGFVVSARRWTIPVYYADEETPATTVRLTATWAPATSLSGVHIPAGAKPDPEHDAHLAVIDQARGCEYELFRASQRSGRWTAEWANAIPLDSSGIYPGGISARASGLAISTGLIFPHELRSGQVRHALIFTAPLTRAGGPVAPATSSDGWSKDPAALPEGARLQLDPSLDLDRLHLAPWQRTIARALQQYGMVLADTGGAVAIELAGASPDEPDPYAGLLPPQDFPRLPVELARHLRVLRLPPQHLPRQYLDTGGCGTFHGLESER